MKNALLLYKSVMALHYSHLLCLITLILILPNSLSPVSCLNRLGPLNSPKVGLYVEGKGRLGSTPPSCHNKCNQCHPCMAVQLPTLPSPTGFNQDPVISYGGDGDGGGGRYSNYKPLGWKCSCRDHFYNP
ncbi:EPIDERMAL PATTERNING FACTOR-like protein 1 [Tripterygium wilfordii]|uniref:EPIDERMAL PATTERNING FACTOR-like protein 1 n=1 Tax=Tripterygium wilfordii TaxID=458696 RepID=UPI0018F83CD5|nr:EPIDERMAL PATTERNING FACTOR-like protein 1 [Tripterygium wilfordii]